jgi:parallel beta-helix repeat protein
MKEEIRSAVALLAVLALVVILVVTMSACPPLPPTEVWVDEGFSSSTPGWGYDHFATIQEGISVVASPGTVYVFDGIYHENITLKDGVRVLAAGAAAPTIDGGGSGPVVTAGDVGSTTKLDGFTITNGSANHGGGMYNYRSSPTVTNCTFSGNTAANHGGGMHNYENSSPTVTNCTFSNNTATLRGGGMHNYGNSSPTVTNCTFSGNTAGEGGGMCNVGSSPTLTNCTFRENATPNPGAGGGGMLNYSSSPTLTNCTFSGNTAAHSGGGMYNYENSSPTVTNCTFSGNTVTGCGGGGGGMRNYNNSSPTLTNCILWGDSPQEIYNYNSTPAVTYCDVQGGYPDTGNIDADPLFANPAADDFHLQADSPCIDVGDNGAPAIPSTDFEGDPRIMNGTVDMGVDEVSSCVLTALSPANGSVGVPPFSVTLEWSTCGGVTSYEVMLARDQALTDIIIFVVVSTTSYGPIELEPDNVYYWQVKALSPYGTYPSEVWSFQTD